MRTPANFHTHCYFCDGQNSPEDLIVESIRLGLHTIGFSSHAPMPFHVRWAMPISRLRSYVQHIRQLALNYSQLIDVRLGFEADFIPNITSPSMPWFGTIDCDYMIGSVHFCGRFPDRTHWAIDASSSEFERGVREIYSGSIQSTVRAYYDRVQSMALNHRPDIIGHFDYPKLFNRNSRYFSETDPWYIDCVDKTLQSIATTSVRIELNTGGVSRGRTDEYYPSAWILERCRHYGIPIVLGSDAHSVSKLTSRLSDAERLLERLGFRPEVTPSPEKHTSGPGWIERYSWR